MTVCTATQPTRAIWLQAARLIFSTLFPVYALVRSLGARSALLRMTHHLYACGAEYARFAMIPLPSWTVTVCPALTFASLSTCPLGH